ncbi:MAG: Crp/Fnr family transcriptional regulator [Clostridiales bacterium]|nr:Crp/Fnr family transcriptional regulator [Clostridiales bacterium]
MELLYGCEMPEFESGNTVGEKYADMLGIVLGGKLKIRSAGDGVLMNTLGAGDIFGAATVFIGKNEMSNITAVQKSSVLFVPGKTIGEIFDSDGAVALSYAKFLSGKIEFLSKKIIAFTSPRSDVALAGYILDNFETDVPAKMNCSAVADKLGIGRTTLYRAINELAGSGLIEFEDGKITVKNVKGLNDRRNLK